MALGLASPVRAEHAPFSEEPSAKVTDTNAEGVVPSGVVEAEIRQVEEQRVEEEPPPATRPAVEAAKPPRERDGFAAFPIVMFSPETHFGGGGFGLYFYRLPGESIESRASSLALVGVLTTRGQAIVEIIPELYFDDEGFHAWMKLEHRRFPDSFFGIGNDIQPEERYGSTLNRGRLFLDRQIVGSLYGGLRIHADHLRITDTVANGSFENGTFTGRHGGTSVGAGVNLSWDTRDHPVSAYRGAYLSSTLTRFSPLVGSDFAFTELAFDFRGYLPLAYQHTLAFQFVSELQDGDVPFHHLAMLGGTDLLRGHFKGRYRDRHMLAAQTEYRFPLFWRFSGVAFAGLGEVFDDFRELDLSYVRWATGGGLRFSLNDQERLNIRVDVGASLDSWGAYLSAGEAF